MPENDQSDMCQRCEIADMFTHERRIIFARMEDIIVINVGGTDCHITPAQLTLVASLLVPSVP